MNWNNSECNILLRNLDVVS